MPVDTPLVVEVALNGTTGPGRNPTVARTTAEITAQGIECIEAGASIIHSHLATHSVPAAEAADHYAETFSAWVAADPDVLVMPTLGTGATIDEKLEHVGLLADRGLARIGFIDPGSLILGWADDAGLPSHDSFVYINTYADMTWAINQAHQHGLAMHFAIFEPGFLRNVFSYWRHDRLTPGSFVKFYFGGPNGYMARGVGVSFGLPPTEAALDAYLEMMTLEGCDLPWFTAVVGGELIDTPIARLTIERGGHLRVGLEDHFADRTPSNLELVSEVVALAEELGRPIATPAQAVEILGIAPIS